MKNFILVSGLIFTTSALACSNRVDPTKVMLFVDTNNSELEIETVKKAACARGETLKVVPKNYLEYGNYTRRVEQVDRRYRAGNCASSNPPRTCAALNEERNAAYQAMNTFTEAQKNYKTQVKEALEEIKAGNGKLQNFSISGHDGGGQFGGAKGSFGRQELSDLMKDFDDINDVKSLLLLGCYTGTQNEVMAWKSIFPKTKLIGGYDGSAPLADRPQGHQYISDILLKERQLTSQADGRRLQSFVDANFRGLNNLNAGIYVQCAEGPEGTDYYYGSKLSRRFKRVEIEECLRKVPELREIATTFEKYFSGELAVPADTSGGALRQLYNRARTYEHCAEVTDVKLDTNGIFNMLFYEGVKQSFAHVYNDDLEAVEQYLNLNAEDLEKSFEENNKPTQESIADLEDDIKLLQEDPQKYFAKKEAKIAAGKEAYLALLNDPKNADIKNFFSENGMTSYPASATQAQIIRLNELQNLSMSYSSAKFSLQSEKESPGSISQIKAKLIQMHKNNLSQSDLNFEKFKQTLSDPSKKIWAPTAANLAKYSRQELMQNIHRMNEALASNALNPTQTKAFSWLNSTTMLHLQGFQNPFDWHEYKGQPSRPQFMNTLQDSLNSPSMSGMYGFGGGFGSSRSQGGSFSIGLVGGSGSGQ